MNTYVVQYHSRTSATLQNFRNLHAGKTEFWIFDYQKPPIKIALKDNIIKKNINLRTGLDLFVNIQSPSTDEAITKSKPYVESLLNLISYSTLSSTEPTNLICVMNISDQKSFPTRFYASSNTQEFIYENSVIESDLLGEVFKAYNDDTMGIDRTARALSWLRKGLNDDQTVDEFLNYWFGVEIISSVLRDRLSLTMKKPDFWYGIEDILKTKLKFDNFKLIYTARNDLAHGSRTLDEAFINEIGSYIPILRNGLIIAIANILQINENLVNNLIKKTPSRIPSKFSFVLEGTVDGLPDDFEKLSYHFPSIGIDEFNKEYSVEEPNKLNVSFSQKHTYNSPLGGKFNVSASELWGHK